MKKLNWLVLSMTLWAGVCLRGSWAEERVLFIGNTLAYPRETLFPVLKEFLRERGASVTPYLELGATFQSHCMNNEGKITPWQTGILDELARLGGDFEAVTTMEMDGMRDFEYGNAQEFFLSRRGRMEEALKKHAPYDVIVLQGFRDALDPERHDFYVSGKKLIEKIRATNPQAKIYLCENWPFSDSPVPAKDCQTIASSYRKLATDNRVKIVPVASAWNRVRAERKEMTLLADRFGVNDRGTFLMACLLYAAVTGRSPEKVPATVLSPIKGASPYCALKEDEAAFLREVAWKAWQAEVSAHGR